MISLVDDFTCDACNAAFKDARRLAVHRQDSTSVGRVQGRLLSALAVRFVQSSSGPIRGYRNIFAEVHHASLHMQPVTSIQPRRQTGCELGPTTPGDQQP